MSVCSEDEEAELALTHDSYCLRSSVIIVFFTNTQTHAHELTQTEWWSVGVSSLSAPIHNAQLSLSFFPCGYLPFVCRSHLDVRIPHTTLATLQICGEYSSIYRFALPRYHCVFDMSFYAQGTTTAQAETTAKLASKHTHTHTPALHYFISNM